MSTLISLTRRNFIRTIAGTALAVGNLPVGEALMAAESAKWPVGCRDIHLKLGGKPDSWSSMKELGADGVEVNVAMDLSCPGLVHPEHKYSLATDDGIKLLQEDLVAGGRRITAFMMANRFEERLEQELACARGLVKAAQALGVLAIRIDVVPQKLGRDAFLPFAVEACKRLCALAEDTPVRFGVENHGKITNEPQFLEKLFDGVGSARLGLTLDCANFYWWGHPQQDLYGIYEKFASRVVHTHCKSIGYPKDKKNVRREMGWEYGKYTCPIYEGDIDFSRLVKILRQANYRGDLCVEDESLGKYPENQRAEIIKKEISALKQLV